MVHLSRIYTRTGDDGGTHLGDGSSLPKNHPRVVSYGTVDELSSIIGMALVDGVGPDGNLTAQHAEWLRVVQNDLFDVGSDLCIPGEAGERLRITAAYVERVEKWIDEVNADLAPLDSFILPGGNRAAAWLHMARTVCRRAERHVVELFIHEEDGRVNHEVLKYLNRVSDLLFVLARAANDGGRADVLWKPGANR